MRVLTIIPARKGSKGVKNKNFLKLGKNTLLEHSCIFAKKLSFVEKIIISSYIEQKKLHKNSIFFFRKDQKIFQRIIH